jgi:hypothetical protein
MVRLLEICSIEISLVVDERGMEAGLKKSQLRQFAPDRGIVVSRRYREPRLAAAFTIPLELSEMARLSLAHSNDAVERRRRQVPGHQSRRAIERPASDADGVVGNAFEDFYPCDSVGQGGGVDAMDDFERRNQSCRTHSASAWALVMREQFAPFR